MCLTIPGKVLKIKNKEILVEIENKEKAVKLGLVKPKIGDYVLVAGGMVIEILDKEQAEKSKKVWDKILKN